MLSNAIARFQAEKAMNTHSPRWRHFFLMLPFFLVGVALPVYFYGFSGDGPPSLTAERYSPVPLPPDAGASSMPVPGALSFDRSRGFGVVAVVRSLFDRAVDAYVSPGLSPLTIRFSVFVLLFVAVFFVVRIFISLVSGVVSSFLMFLLHKAAAPMFMGFLAVGSTWGIHQTVAGEFGMTWAAATVTLTAAIASLFALAGVKIR